VDKIESNARSEGYLQGDYLVSFPTPIDDFASVRDEIQAKLLEYIHSTKALEKASLEMVFEKVISQQRPQQCGIQKVGSHLDRVVAGGPVWFKWEGDAARDICDLLIESLLTKVNKLRNINEPKILLLLDEYSFADRYMYENCLSHLSSLVDFHTIFVVYSSKGGFTLHSENRNWLN